MSRNLVTPVKYFGGKTNMSNTILEYFPEPGTYNTYVEPFGGSYSIGLKLNPLPPNEIYNDLDNNVYSLYKVLSDPDLYKEFKHLCDVVLYSETIRSVFKKELTFNDLSVLDRAFYFFYVNRTSHNGVGGFSMNTIVRRNMSKSVSDFLSAIDRLDDLHNRLSRVIVRNTDGIELIEKFNRPNAMIYCDPPYEQSTRTSTRYQVDMNREQHEKFLSTVMDSKAKILISGYDCDLYDVLEENGFKKIHFVVKTISGTFTPKTKVETLWKNY